MKNTVWHGQCGYMHASTLRILCLKRLSWFFRARCALLLSAASPCPPRPPSTSGATKENGSRRTRQGDNSSETKMERAYIQATREGRTRSVSVITASQHRGCSQHEQVRTPRIAGGAATVTPSAHPLPPRWPPAPPAALPPRCPTPSASVREETWAHAPLAAWAADQSGTPPQPLPPPLPQPPPMSLRPPLQVKTTTAALRVHLRGTINPLLRVDNDPQPRGRPEGGGSGGT